MGKSGNVVPTIVKAEHIGPDDTGDNIEAKRAALYQWDGNNWQRQPVSLLDKSYDEVDFSNPDANGNYQTVAFKSASSTVRTLTLAFDGSNNVTSITRS